MERLKSFHPTYDHIGGVVPERGMILEYERTEMLLHALPKRLWMKLITQLGLNLLDPPAFHYGKLRDWATSKVSAAEAVAMVEFLAPTAAPMTNNATTAPPMSPASIYLINPTALTTSPASTASPTLIASPVPLAPTASTSPMATTSTLASPGSSAPAVCSTPATGKTHTTSLVSTTSPASAATSQASLVSLAPFTPAAAETTTTIPITAKVPLTTVIITTLPLAHSTVARPGIIHAGPTVRLGMIHAESPQEPLVCRQHFVQPEHREEAARPNHQVPNQQHCPQANPQCIQEPAPPNSEEVVRPPPCLYPLQPQRDHPPCYDCEGQYNLRNCLNLCTNLENGIVSINYRNRLVLGPAGGDIPLAPAHHDYRPIRD